MYLLFLIITYYVHADFSFISMGDWGGDDAPRYVKQSQCDAGKGMEQIALKYRIDTVLAVGDNFYHNGVTEANVDKYMERTFNDVYKGPQLNKANFYAVAGNHDHRGSVEAQIGYKSSKVTRWNFPDYWYSFTKDVGSGMTAEFLMIDTVLLAGESFHDIENNIFVSATGPKNLQKAQSQWTWLETKMRDSTADFLFVVGHYPVYSPCSHGSTSILVNNLEPLLRRYQVTAYIAGHDHCASYVATGDGPVYPMNGMGDTCCYSAKKKKKLEKLLSDPSSLQFYVAKDNAKRYGSPSAGFSSYTLQTNGKMSIRFHDEDGGELFTTSVMSERAMKLMTLNKSEGFLENNEYFQWVGIALGSCLYGFLLTICWRTCRKPKSELNEDLILDERTEN